MQPKISVIIPVYNMEKYLQTCIDSMLAQTMEEIEFIFINDASTDSSLKILHDNQEKNPEKIRVIDSKMNMKQGGARNLGIQASQAPYIGFVDSDDFIASDMYERLYLRIKETEADAAFVQATYVNEQGEYMDIDEATGKPRPYVVWNNSILQWNDTTLTNQARMDIMCNPIGGIWSGLWKKDIIVENNLLFPYGLRYEDNLWGSLVVCYLTKISLVQEICYYYRQNSESTVHGRNTIYHFDRITIENRLIEEAKLRGLLEVYYDAFEYTYIVRYALNTYYTILFRFDSVPKDKLKRVVTDLNRTFPEWRKNVFFRRSNLKTHIKSLLIQLPVPLVILLKRLLRK